MTTATANEQIPFIALPADAQKELADKWTKQLADIFPKTESEPVYSIGFQRWQKLTKKQSLALHKKYNFDGNRIKILLETKTAKELLV